MNIRRIEIDYQTGILTVDADVNEEFGRELEFDLATLSDIRDLADEIARRSQMAVVARIRTWLDRLEPVAPIPSAGSGSG